TAYHSVKSDTTGADSDRRANQAADSPLGVSATMRDGPLGARLVEADRYRGEAPQADRLLVTPDRLRAELDKAFERGQTHLTFHLFDDGVADENRNVESPRKVFDAVR